jgi:hypothetical protein
MNTESGSRAPRLLVVAYAFCPVIRACPAVGSAPRSGRGGRRFKSCHSDHFLEPPIAYAASYAERNSPVMISRGRYTSIPQPYLSHERWPSLPVFWRRGTRADEAAAGRLGQGGQGSPNRRCSGQSPSGASSTMLIAGLGPWVPAPFDPAPVSSRWTGIAKSGTLVGGRLTPDL